MKRNLKTTFGLTRLTLCLTGILGFTGCSNLGGDEDEDADSATPVTSSQRSITTASGFAKGDVFMQKLSLLAGQSVTSTIFGTGASLRLADSEDVSLEVMVLDTEGEELVFEREDTAGGVIAYEPTVDGDYTVLIKNNHESPVDYPEILNEGIVAEEEVILAKESTEAVNDQILLKGVVALSRNCVELDSSGNGVTVSAPTGTYYVQPLIFYGSVDSTGVVTNLDSATMSIVSGASTVTLKSLPNMTRKVYRDIYASNSSLTDDEERHLTRLFYQSYFAASGELYSVDTFRKGGECAQAGTIALGTDVGATEINLRVVDSTQNIDQTISLRATISPSFSMYLAADSKLSDWTQCTYNRQTAEPKTYNGDATSCKSFSLSATPFLRLDYLMPSATVTGATIASDPTRVVFYGHSYSKEWYKTLIDNATTLSSATSPTATLSRCLNNGGIVAVPLDPDLDSYVPLNEFNVVSGDVINLARRSGSYTALPSFYQGNVSNASTVKVASCIPLSGSDCGAYKQINVTVSSCSIKADSGISVLSVSDSYIYPDYFEMSGVIAP